jgi:flagellar export protein FliJ
VRLQRERAEEWKLAAIIKQLKIAQADLANLSVELTQITAKRLDEIQYVVPNTHYQAVETYSRALWQRCANQAAEIEKLREAHAHQMSAYLSAHQEREVMENLNKHHCDALEAERRLRERKLNDDLFLARRGARWDT